MSAYADTSFLLSFVGQDRNTGAAQAYLAAVTMAPDIPLTLFGALVDQACQQHPRSSSAQLLTLARGGFKELVRAAFPPDGDPLEPDDHTT